MKNIYLSLWIKARRKILADKRDFYMTISGIIIFTATILMFVLSYKEYIAAFAQSPLRQLLLIALPYFLLFDGGIKAWFMKRILPLPVSYLIPFYPKQWNLHLIIRDAVNLWNLYILVPLLILFLLGMPLNESLTLAGYYYLASIYNSRTVCLMQKFIALQKWTFLTIGLIGYVAILFAVRNTTCTTSSLEANFTLWGIWAASTALLYSLYFCIGEKYRNKVAVHLKESYNINSGLVIESISIWRSKRISFMLLMCGILIYQCYNIISPGMPAMISETLVLCSLFMPCVILGGYNFGIEANYFDGIWTKPISVYSILRRKFLLLFILSSIVGIALLPLAFMGKIEFQPLIALWIFSSCFYNLLVQPLALLNKRFDVAGKVAFNYQGNSSKSMLLGYLGLGIVVGLYIGLHIMHSDILVPCYLYGAAGIVALVFKTYILKYICQKFEENRYSIMKRYRIL